MVDKSSVGGFQSRLFQAQIAYEGRAGKRLDRTSFAGMVGVSQPTASDWFNGHRTPSLVQTETIANALGVSPAWLAFGMGEGVPVVYPPAKLETSRKSRPPAKTRFGR